MYFNVTMYRVADQTEHEFILQVATFNTFPDGKNWRFILKQISSLSRTHDLHLKSVFFDKAYEIL